LLHEIFNQEISNPNALSPEGKAFGKSVMDQSADSGASQGLNSNGGTKAAIVPLLLKSKQWKVLLTAAPFPFGNKWQ